MVKSVVFLATLIAVCVTGAVVTPATKAQGSGIQEQINSLVLQVQTLANTVTTSLINVIPDTKQITDGLISQTQLFSQNVQGIMKRIQSEINKNKRNVDNLVKATTASLNNVVSSFQSLIDPENRAKTSDIRTQLNNSLKNVTADIQKLAKAVQPEVQGTGETLQNFAKGIVNDFVKAYNNLKTQVNALSSIGRK